MTDRIAGQPRIVVSPALLGWLQRAPSHRVATHRSRWESTPAAPQPDDTTEEPTDDEDATGG